MQNFYNYEKNKNYSIEDAVSISKENSKVKNNDTLAIAIKLNLSKNSSQLAGEIKIPHYVGKIKKILVIDEKLSSKDFLSNEMINIMGKEAINKIIDGYSDFDLIVANVDLENEINKIFHLLDRKGVMPTLKIGNLTSDVKKYINNILLSSCKYKNDKYGNVQVVIGKTHMDTNKIVENIKFFIDFIKSLKPKGLHGEFIQNISLSSTLGPGIKIQFDNNVNTSFKKPEVINLIKKEEPKAKPERKVSEEALMREKEQLKVVETKTKENIKDDKSLIKEEEKTSIIMISIDPKKAESFLDDDAKNVLFYKITPVNKVQRVLIYATSPVKGVIGEFDLEKIEICALSTAWKKYSSHSVLTKKEFDEYYEGKEKAHILVSHKSFWYSKPKELKDFHMEKGPSGFQYLK